MNITEIQLLSGDINATKNFYNEILEMPILYTDDSSTKISSGLSALTFRQTKKDNPFYHFAFTIPSNQFAEAHAWTSQQIELLPVTQGNTIADFKNWNAKAFYFYDNNRNIVEFIARFDLKNNSDKPFTGSSVYSISEIGIVADDAGAYSKQIIDEYGLNFFFRQPPQNDFAAVGDDHGLFIVVNEKRNWYPTHQPSGKYWTVIKAEHNDKAIAIELGNK